MAFSKRAQAGKIANRPQGGGNSKAGIPSSIGRNRQLVFKLKSRSYTPSNIKKLNGKMIDGPISGAIVTIKSMNGTLLGTTTTNSVGEFSFNSNSLLPNTYYLIETSSGTDTITNLFIEVGLTLLMKTSADGTANVVLSPVSTILKEMIGTNNLSELSTSQIDTLVSQNKSALGNYLKTGTDSINNIETTNFFNTNNIDLYKENAAIYSYLRTTYEIEQNIYDERNPITELANALTTGNANNGIGGLITTNTSFTKYTNNQPLNNGGTTVSQLITEMSTSQTINAVSTTLQTTYTDVEYPKQYNLDLIHTISVPPLQSPYGIAIDTTGRFLTYSKGVDGFKIKDLSNNAILLDIPGNRITTGSQLGFDLTMNDQFVIVGSNMSSTSTSEFAGKGYCQIYKKTQAPSYWEYMTTISGETVKDQFGFGMSIYNDELMVSSNARNYADVSGQVQIFKLNADTDGYSRIFDISGESERSSLGANNGCSIYENYAVIGSSRAKYNQNNNISCGKAIVLKKVSGTWSKMTDIFPPSKYVTGEKGNFNNDGTLRDPSGSSQYKIAFGFSVGITNQYLAVGGFFYSDMSGSTVLKSCCGAVFLYKLSGNSWEYLTIFVGDEIKGNYGYDIQITDDFLVVSAFESGKNTAVGSVYIYERGPYDTWGFKKKIRNPLLGQNLSSSFGYKIDLKTDYLAVTDSNNKMYVYKKNEII
jgi:hypothetical protein